MSRFWQLFRPALARKAGQRDPQTLIGGLGAHHGTSRSKSGKKFSPSAMTLRTQAASACDKRHPCTSSTGIQQGRRSVHALICQGNAAARNFDAAIALRSAATELLNPPTIELRTTALEIAAPKLGLVAKAKQNTILKHF